VKKASSEKIDPLKTIKSFSKFENNLKNPMLFFSEK